MQIFCAPLAIHVLHACPLTLAAVQLALPCTFEGGCGGAYGVCALLGADIYHPTLLVLGAIQLPQPLKGLAHWRTAAVTCTQSARCEHNIHHAWELVAGAE